jgi:omega-amidase
MIVLVNMVIDKNNYSILKIYFIFHPLFHLIGFSMRIALIQLAPDWESPKETIAQIENLGLEKIDADLILFPELTLTGFTMNSEMLAEELDGVSTTFFIGLAKKLKKHIIAGLIENYDDRRYNNAVHFDRDGLIAARYRKIHPYSYAGEDKSYSGSKELVTTKIDNHVFGLSVCYDLRFPELYRMYAKQGVEAIINIANWPVQRIHHWNHLLKARAIENLCYVIGCNRIGDDPFNKYNGQSAVYAPFGNTLIQLDDESGIHSVEIDFAEVQKVREKYKFLDDIKLV